MMLEQVIYLIRRGHNVNVMGVLEWYADFAGSECPKLWYHYPYETSLGAFTGTFKATSHPKEGDFVILVQTFEGKEGEETTVSATTGIWKSHHPSENSPHGYLECGAIVKTWEPGFGDGVVEYINEGRIIIGL